ncbi:hypothetical protein FDUTEX481_04290 [Tolypothrix sp. PCC 7601]|nr:hypothetical protein FDUTEX481_04290 [Tolypothrix sp. PCC 7601]
MLALTSLSTLLECRTQTGEKSPISAHLGQAIKSEPKLNLKITPVKYMYPMGTTIRKTAT